MAAESKAPFLSVVVPVFNEEENLDRLCDRLLPVLRGLGVPFEAILVDDGSRDRTLEKLEAQARRNPEILVRSFPRNFGQHAAVTAGFAASRGEFVVTLDADLQNPPEEIPRLVAEFKKGHDLVGTIRQGRQDTWFRKRASAFVNKMTRRMSGINLHDFGCMLRGYSSEIAHAIANRREVRTFIPALGYLYARNPVEIHVKHESRAAGHSKYSLIRLLRLHMDLMTGFSLAPLRLMISMGFAIAAASTLFGLVLFVLRFVKGPDWAAFGVFTLFAFLFLFVGFQFVAFGLLGEYIGRIFLAVRERPAYLLRTKADAREAGDEFTIEPKVRGAVPRSTSEREPVEERRK